MTQAPAVLLLSHATVAHRVAAHVAAAWPGCQIDILMYGRAADDAPAPPQVREAIPLPAKRPGAAARLLRRLRRGRYDLAVVGHPGLRISWARGALLGFALAGGAREIVAVDPEHGRLARIARGFALRDAARFTFAAGGARLVAPVVGLAVETWARRQAGSPPAPEPPARGAVVYLRTDLDLVLAPLTAGGSLAHTDGILRALVRRGHDVALWTTGAMRGLPDDVAEQRLPAPLRPNVPWELAELVAGLVQARRVARPASEVAFVYQRYSLNNLAGLLLARRWGVPFVLEANGSEAAWRRLWTSLRFPRLAGATERLLLTGADRVAAVSENAADDLRATAQLDGRLRVVPNGVEVERFWDAAPKDLPFEEDAFVIAFAGLFYPWHGARFLAEAFPLVLQRRPSARLLLVGDGEEASLIRFVLERAGVAERVLHTGLVPRAAVPGYLAAADVLVSPHVRNDRFIGLPIKIWEYMASGRAIVATRVAQMGEVLRHRETALLVEPDDPEALADAIVELHDDEKLAPR